MLQQVACNIKLFLSPLFKWMNDSVTLIHPQGCTVIANVHFQNYIIPDRNYTHQTVTPLPSPKLKYLLSSTFCLHVCSCSKHLTWVELLHASLSVFICCGFCGSFMSRAVSVLVLHFLRFLNCCVYLYVLSIIHLWVDIWVITTIWLLPILLWLCCTYCLLRSRFGCLGHGSGSEIVGSYVLKVLPVTNM